MIPAGQRGAFVASMEQVLDVYKRPYDPENPVVCIDEMPKQLIQEAVRLSLIPRELYTTTPSTSETGRQTCSWASSPSLAKEWQG